MERAIHAIADPRRREILRMVARRERAAGEIAEAFGDISRPAVSQHLRVLRGAGLLSERREGTKRLYQSNAAGIAQLRRFMESFWDIHLAELARAAPRSERNHRGKRK